MVWLLWYFLFCLVYLGYFIYITRKELKKYFIAQNKEVGKIINSKTSKVKHRYPKALWYLIKANWYLIYTILFYPITFSQIWLNNFQELEKVKKYNIELYLGVYSFKDFTRLFKEFIGFFPKIKNKIAVKIIPESYYKKIDNLYDR